MALSHVTRVEAVERLAQHHGNPASIETLSELLRAEVHARGHAPRAATLSRVARLLARALNVEVEQLDEVCEALEREGDLVLAPGGILYATPTRAVLLKQSARIFSSVPTLALAPALKRALLVKGATRTVAALDGLAEAVANVAGQIVTPETWAGIDRTPPADAAFLANLDLRLHWEPSGAASLEKDGVLEWCTWQILGEGPRWRRSQEGRLWWARTRFGGHHHAWTASSSPSTSPFIALSSDDADRARFALSRSVGASILRVRRSNGLTLEIPSWLPRSEHRWLSLHAVRAVGSKGLCWEVAVDDEAHVTNLLTERLGLVVESG
jgi:hypothetical protein